MRVSELIRIASETKDTRKRMSRNVLLAALSVPAIGLGMAVGGLRANDSDDAELARIGADEVLIFKMYNDAISQAQKGTLDDAGVLAVLDKDVLPQWGAIPQRFNRVKKVPGLNAKRRQQIEEYLATREEGFELLRTALSTGDAGAAAKAQEKMLQADRLAAELGRGK